MSYTFVRTESSTFTRTSARYLSSKVAADLHRLHRYYGRPSLVEIQKYDEELTILLAGGYVESVEYGLRVADERVLTLRYTVQADGSLSDGNAGGVHARGDVGNAAWFSYLTYNARWRSLTQSERNRIGGESPRPADLRGGAARRRWLLGIRPELRS